MFWYNDSKIFYFKDYLILRALFPEEIDRDYSQLSAGCSTLGLFGLLYLDV